MLNTQAQILLFQTRCSFHSNQESICFELELWFLFIVKGNKVSGLAFVELSNGFQTSKKCALTKKSNYAVSLTRGKTKSNWDSLRFTRVKSTFSLAWYRLHIHTYFGYLTADWFIQSLAIEEGLNGV